MTTTTSQTTTYHMPLDDVLDLWSGDYDLPVREIRAEMDANSGQDCWHSEAGYGLCHEFIHHLATDMRERGWSGPPVCITGRNLTNGHHRVMAAQDAGLQDIPYTKDWEASGGPSW